MSTAEAPGRAVARRRRSGGPQAPDAPPKRSCPPEIAPDAATLQELTMPAPRGLMFLSSRGDQLLETQVTGMRHTMVTDRRAKVVHELVQPVDADGYAPQRWVLCFPDDGSVRDEQGRFWSSAVAWLASRKR